MQQKSYSDDTKTTIVSCLSQKIDSLSHLLVSSDLESLTSKNCYCSRYGFIEWQDVDIIAIIVRARNRLQ